MPTSAPLPEGTTRDRATRYSPAQRRTADASFALFGEHGVAGTSLQRIADSLGVTKAAVYHQFPTKDSIVVAVLDVQLEPLEAAVEVAEAAGGGPDARAELLATIVDGVVVNRRAWATLQSDPTMLRLLGEHEPSRRLWGRLFDQLVGNGTDPSSRVRAAVLSASIGASSHPFVADLDDETLATELLAALDELIR